MVPGRYDMVCPQGSTFTKQLTYTIDDVPVNLTGYTARMQVREKHESKTFVVELTTENGRITLGGSLGTIDLEIPASATTAIIAKDYVYDLEVVAGSNVYRLIEGKFIVTPEVTR
jgi:molybdopterin-binding protein